MLSDTLFDTRGGEADRDEGMAQALAASGLWAVAAREALKQLAATRLPFMVDDLLAIVGLPHEVGINANNAIGAAFGWAQGIGLIRPTGERVKTRRRTNHGRKVTQWVGV